MKKKTLVSVFLSLFLVLGIIGIKIPVYAENSGGEQLMYRMYNPNSGEHFYTAVKEERNDLFEVGWTYEGIGWVAPVSSSHPVYRLYNKNGGEHHYTLHEDERDMLVAAGWRYEGIGWYSDDNETVPLYRQYNPNVFSCNHNYTTDQAENDYLVSIGWKYEGIGWYAVRETSDEDRNNDDLVTGSKYPTFPSLASVGIGYGSGVDAIVDAELRTMYQFFRDDVGIDVSSMSDYDKAVCILLYVGLNFDYGDGSYTAASMIQKRYGTCFAYSDVVYCFARKMGLINSWLTVPGRNVDHNGQSYGSQHRTVVSIIDGNYYDLDGNMALYTVRYFGEVPEPEHITYSYASYLLGNSDSYSSINP